MSNQPSNKQNGDVDGKNSSASSSTTGGSRYVPPALRNKMMNEPRSTREPSSSSNGPSDDKFSNFRSNNRDRPSNYDRAPRSGSDGVNGDRRGTGQGFFDRDTTSAPRRSKWNEDSPSGGSYERGGKRGRAQVGEDGLLPREPRLEEELFSSHSNTGINFDKYQDIPVEAFGEDVPAACQRFSDLNLHPVLKNAISLCGYDVPTPVQQYALPIILGRRDLMACAQTGSGKTAAFLFPTIGRLLEDLADMPPSSGGGHGKTYPTALVLAPTRELALQIYDEARKFTYRSLIRPVVVYGGADFATQFKDLARGCDILVATPGRLVDMMDRGKVSLSKCRFLCLDEADRMLDMGFEKQIRYIVDEADMPGVGARQTLMFSATFPKEIQRLAADFLDNYIFLKVGRVGSTTDFITQNLLYVEDHDKMKHLMEAINQIEGLTLIFVETKRSADRLEEFLYNEGFPSTSIHGDRSQREREQALESFRTGRTPILVATDVAARGLDISNVTHVINFDMPRDIDDYVHRIGRTGRAGNSGVATAFFNDKNRNLVRELLVLLEEANQKVPTWLTSMNTEISRSGRSTGGSSYGRSGGYGSGGRSGGGYSSGGRGPSGAQQGRGSRGGVSDFRYEDSRSNGQESHAPNPMGPSGYGGSSSSSKSSGGGKSWW